MVSTLIELLHAHILAHSVCASASKEPASALCDRHHSLTVRATRSSQSSYHFSKTLKTSKLLASGSTTCKQAAAPSCPHAFKFSSEKMKPGARPIQVQSSSIETCTQVVSMRIGIAFPLSSSGLYCVARLKFRRYLSLNSYAARSASNTSS